MPAETAPTIPQTIEVPVEAIVDTLGRIVAMSELCALITGTDTPAEFIESAGWPLSEALSQSGIDINSMLVERRRLLLMRDWSESVMAQIAKSIREDEKRLGDRDG